MLYPYMGVVGGLVMYFICVFLPALFSIVISEKINNRKMTGKELVINYGCYTFLITMLVNTLFSIFCSQEWTYSNEMFTYNFATKYLWISFIISVLLPYIYKVITKVFSINVEVKERSKDEKKEEPKRKARSKKKTKKNSKKSR